MHQPFKYLIIGSGRMATHFCYYLKLLNLPWQQWSRKSNTFQELVEYSKTCSHILLLISDRTIEDFINTAPFLLTKCCVHFSGRLVVQNCVSAHPLMTFSHKLYDLNVYRSIPFVLEKEGPDFGSCRRTSKKLYSKIKRTMMPVSSGIKLV